MYSYKLNNSYTVYVNYAYLNECIKASKKKNKSSSVKTYIAPIKKEKPVVCNLLVERTAYAAERNHLDRRN